MPQTMVIPFDKQEIGQGFNSQTRENLGTALMFTDTSEDAVAPGQDVTTFFENVSDQESLMHSLGVSASVDARYMLFSADAKLDFAESNAVNSYSSYVVGRCLVKNALRRGHGFKLTPDAEAVLHKPVVGMDEFKTAFGDMFVRSLNTGGEFLVVARITSISEEHQRTLAASLHGEYNGLTVSISLSAAFTNAMSETHNHTDVTVWMRQRGGQDADFKFTGLEASKVLEHLADFPTIARQHPIAYEAEVAAYNTIPIDIPTIEETEAQRFVLADCLQQKIGFLAALSDLELATSDETSVQFDDLPSKDELNRMKGQYRTALGALFSHAISVSTGHMNPPLPFVANPAPPAINFKKKPFAPPPPTVKIRMPDLLALRDEGDFRRITDLLLCLGPGGGDLDGCLAGTSDIGPDNIVRPIDLPRDVAEFLNLYTRRQIKVRWIPDDPIGVVEGVGGSTNFSIQSQFPAPGVEVTDQSEVIVNIIEVPE